jgi:hydroxymethylpyrimidine pyrophosphatase-like HAD family hydrolase
VRPLAELDARGIEGVVFDVDDTITREGVVERVAFDALWALRDRGLVAMAVTGRPLGWTDAIAGIWPVAAAVGENGAGWALRRGPHMELGAEPIADPGLRDRVRARVAAALPHVRVASDQPARRADLAFDVGEAARLPAETIAAIVAIIEAEGGRALVSSVHAHAMPGVWDKASGARRAAAALGIDAERLRTRFVFVGDSGNDAPAFAFFEQTVGVANVTHHLGRLAKPPRFVTPSDRGRGFAELVGHLLSEKL